MRVLITQSFRKLHRGREEGAATNRYCKPDSMMTRMYAYCWITVIGPVFVSPFLILFLDWCALITKVDGLLA